MKIFVNKENAHWILDDIRQDFVELSKHKMVDINESPDICWFLNPWGFFDMLTMQRKPNCSCIASIHHIDKTKIAAWRFDIFNKYLDGCIVPNIHTKEIVSKYLTVPIYHIPYWLLIKRMRLSNINIVQEKKELSSNNEILIGSFQKDGEGDTNRPKLSKGPDVLLDILIRLKKTHNIKVILSGYNRKYLLENFKKNEIPFLYLERFKDLNFLYDCIDWYFITSRTEGGPQSVLEASYRKVKILSTDVGMASEVLHPDCICGNVDMFIEKFNNGLDQRIYNYQNVVDNYLPEKGIRRFDNFFEGLK